MLFDLVVVACVAFAAAGVILLVSKLLRRKAPKTLILVTVGLTVIGFSTWNRYSWADRTAAALPPEVEVIQEIEGGTAFEPWTKIFPQITGLVVLDRALTRANPEHPHKQWVTLLLIGRDEPDTIKLERIVDCATERWASVGPGTELDDQGLPRDSGWESGGEPRYLFDAVCR